MKIGYTGDISQQPVYPIEQLLEKLTNFSQIILHAGIATNGTKDSLLEEGMRWQVGMWRDFDIVIITGMGSNQVRIIRDNTYNRIYVSEDWDTPPDGTSVYVIRARTLIPTATPVEHEIVFDALPVLGDSLSTLIEWRGSRMMFHATSTADQNCILQVVGNIRNSPDGLVDIGLAMPLGAGNVNTQYLSVGCAWDDWHQYVGVKITFAVAPTVGKLTIEAVQKE